MTMDSNEPYSTILTLHNSNVYHLRPTASRIRDSVEIVEIDVIQWIARTHNLADDLTKKNLSTYIPNDTIVSESLPSVVFEQAKRANIISPISQCCKRLH